jgi:AraC-like DNA-binding protein
MSKPSRTDQATFCRARFLPEVELVSVAYRDRVFPEHSHEEVVIGAITAGAETLTVRGRPHLVGTGSVLRLHPGEVHANATVGPDELRYAVLYIPADILLGYFGGDAPADVRFDTPVTRDPGLHRIVCRTHRVLAAPAAGKLAQESAMGALALRIGIRVAGGAVTGTIASAAVEQARRYIDDHTFDNFGLCDLSRLTGLSAFHLVRTFKRAVGLSPLAYRNQRRIVAARQRLVDGEATAQIALDLGYADQSHFTRHFQRIVGVSPQRYARAIIRT